MLYTVKIRPMHGKTKLIYAIKLLRDYFYPNMGIYIANQILAGEKTIDLNKFLYEHLKESEYLQIELVSTSGEESDGPSMTSHDKWYYELSDRQKTFVQRLHEDWSYCQENGIKE